MQAARYWRRCGDRNYCCDLCPHRCVLEEGRTGICKVRGVRDGKFVALAYGAVSSAHLDPIEKKPLYHFHPGSAIFSIGSWGCNFGCVFCQNWTISQRLMEDGDRYTPDDVAQLAGADGSVGLAYTYNEPVIAIEFVMDCAAKVRDRGLKNVLVTNGFVNAEPAAALLRLVDAMNVDIKSMDEEFYRTQCKGRLAPVLSFAEQAVRAGCHVEITNLVIPGMNDADRNFEALAEWVASHLGQGVPLHLSGYRPEYRSKVAPTPLATLQRAHAICRRRLSYVYMGNVLTAQGQDTLCPGCGARIVRRWGYSTEITGVRDGSCAACGREADLRL